MLPRRIPFRGECGTSVFVGGGIPRASGSVVRKGGIKPLWHKHLLFGNQKHRTSLIESADVLSRKYGTLMQRSPMFSTSHILKKAVSTSPSKKCFVIFSYIPTPRYRKSLYTLVISGVGLGVGFLPRCRIVLHFPPFHPFFPHLSDTKASQKARFRAKCSRKLPVS